MNDVTRLIKRHNNPLGVSLLLYLGWLSQCDGHIHDHERSILSALSNQILTDDLTVSILDASRQISSTDLVVIFQNIHRLTDPANRIAFFEFALSLALADGVLSVGENHALRLLADVLTLSDKTMHRSFRAVTGRDLPEPGDVSSAKWWDRQQKKSASSSRRSESSRNSESSRHSRTGSGKSSGQRPLNDREKAYLRLGLEFGASPGEIKAAYKRLAKAHHPDRFSDLEESVIEAASVSFREIREAYEYLSK